MFTDNRGYFMESYNQEQFFKETKQKIDFVQDNESSSVKNTLRGMHFQKGKYAQSKLVRVTQGKVLDIVIDLRKNAKTFLEVYSIVLSDENKKQLFIPRGLAHGYVTLSDTARFQYKCDAFYHKASESGIRYDDPIFDNIWKNLEKNAFIISEKDFELPYLKDLI